MKKYLVLISVVLFFFSLCLAQTTERSSRTTPDTVHVVATPEAVQWKPFLLGAEIAVISGDPDKAGVPFVIRVKHPDGMRVAPHWHPIDEHLTVITGTFVVGMGEKFDLSKGQEMPPGSYALVPKKMPHFALAKGETIVQAHGIGPFAVTFVNPADDPRRKGSSK